MNFTEDYKKLMVDTENTVKAANAPEILPEDVFLEIMKLQSGPMFELFASYGINEKITQEVFSKRPFNEFRKGASGNYVGLSIRIKELIILSVKLAASFEKSKAGTEDFLLALLRSNNEPWIYQFFDFVGVSPKDLEEQLVRYSRTLGKNHEGLFAPLEGILSALENNMLQAEDMNNPFFANKKQESKKQESTTPALDFF